ncbi:MAG: AmmeMemoRadiSam system protein A [Planctomycetota bacterium]|nr:MAG: AmmeMemoRadiSam system protein A [Planctomycetota bacterium]
MECVGSGPRLHEIRGAMRTCKDRGKTMSSFQVVTSPADRQALLRYARAVARHALGGRGEPPSKPNVAAPFGGAFVTFWNGSRLRGCMGTFAPVGDLADTIAYVTRLSLEDPRFRNDPITAEELPALTIEVSILSEATPTRDPASLIPGRHGIIIRRGGRSGCFLPKVAEERGWSAEEFLSQCCVMKAGLPADAWRDPETEVLLFEADAFSESRPGGDGNDPAGQPMKP